VVDDEHSPFRHAFVTGDVIATNAVVGDHRALKVGDQLKGETAELLGESLVRKDRVDADGVDTDPVGNRLLVPGPKLGQLSPSTTCEVEHIKKEDERLVLVERLGERELMTPRGRQLEVWGAVSDSEH
jgi:hypothetical protein